MVFPFSRFISILQFAARPEMNGVAVAVCIYCFLFACIEGRGAARQSDLTDDDDEKSV